MSTVQARWSRLMYNGITLDEVDSWLLLVKQLFHTVFESGMNMHFEFVMSYESKAFFLLLWEKVDIS